MGPMTEPSYYELLGVEPSASEADIKSAFRQEALRIHPDKGGNPALFRLIEQAYDTLNSPSRRESYDASHGFARTSTYTAQPGPGYAYEEAQPTGQWTQADWNDNLWNDNARNDSAWHDDHATARTDREPPPGMHDNADFPALRRYRLLEFIGYSWHGFSVWMFGGVAAWILLALALNWTAIPGVDNFTVIKVVVVIFFLWAFGSLLLRIASLLLTLLTLWNAHQSNPPPTSTTATMLAVALGLWLSAHWIYIWKNGYPKSIIAVGILGNLPGIFNPMWKWDK